MKPQLYESFNTSHVVVYLRDLLFFVLHIFSFNTSHVVVYPANYYKYAVSTVLFQYISCCSLSCIIHQRNRLFSSFNTSHVVVYLCDCAVELYSEIGFNTSHVVVYRDFVLHKGLQKRVSIHLML